MLTQRACFIRCISLFIVLQGTVSAAELVGSLKSGSSETFANFKYHAYEFSVRSAGKFHIVMRSKMFDPYLMIIGPDNSVIDNDDHQISGVLQSGNDAGIAVTAPAEGRWVVIATSLDPDQDGDYTLEYEGVSRLDTANWVSESSNILTAAFTARGVDVENRRLRRDALLEQLTLHSFREELRVELQKEIARLKKDNEDLRRRLSTLEEKHDQLAKALVDIENLTESKDLIRDLVARDLNVTQNDLRSLEEELVRSMRESSAFVVALGELGKLNAIADELRKHEDSLLRNTSSMGADDLRAAIVRLRGEREALGRVIAEKLLDSRVVQDRRLGGFRILEPQITVLNRQLDAESKRIGNRLEVDRRVARGSGGSVLGGVLGGVLAEASFSRRVVKTPIDPSVWLPALFPWPPPEPSSRVVLEQRLLNRDGLAVATLGDLDNIIQRALKDAGYSGSSYWGVPGGFAIVTPLEQTDNAGIPLASGIRWLVVIAEMKSFSLTEYLKALFTAPRGYFRVLVFVMSTEPFAPSGSRARLATIERWSQSGFNFLPDTIRTEAFSERHRITVLIYEFLKRQDSEKPETSIPGRLAALDHLRATKLIAFTGQ